MPSEILLTTNTDPLLHGYQVLQLGKDLSGFGAIWSGFVTASPAISASDMGPTVFSGLAGLLDENLQIDTAVGDSQFLALEPGVMQLSITVVVPEPSTLSLLGIASLSCVSWRRRRTD